MNLKRLLERFNLLSFINKHFYVYITMQMKIEFQCRTSMTEKCKGRYFPNLLIVEL